MLHIIGLSSHWIQLLEVFTLLEPVFKNKLRSIEEAKQAGKMMIFWLMKIKCFTEEAFADEEDEEEEEEEKLEVRIRMRIYSKYNNSNTYTRTVWEYLRSTVAGETRQSAGPRGRLAFYTRSLVVDTRRTHGQ
jgi:hypothetical protein